MAGSFSSGFFFFFGHMVGVFAIGVMWWVGETSGLFLRIS